MLTGLKRRLNRREDSMAVQSVVLTAARAAGFAVSVAIPIVLVRVFAQAEFGIYKQIFLISATALPLIDLGMYASVFYFVPRDEGDGHRWVTQAVGFLAFTGALAGVAILLAAAPIGELFDAPAIVDYAPLLAVYVFFAAASKLVLAVPVADRRPMLAGTVMTVTQLLNAASIVVAAVLFRSLEAVLWGAILSQVLRFVALLVYMRARRTGGSAGASWSGLKEQLAYSLPFAVAIFFQIALDRTHQYFVAARVSPEDFAIYAVGILQVPVVGMFVQSIVEVMTIRASEAHQNGDTQGLRRVWARSTHRLAVVLLGAFACVQALAPDLVGLLFGENYLSAVPVFRIYLLTLVLMIVVDHGILRATDDTRFLVGANSVGFGGSLLALWIFGGSDPLLTGVAAYIAGLTLARMAGLGRIMTRLDLPVGQALPWRAFRDAGAAALLSASLVLWLIPELPWRALRIAVGGTVFLAAYGGLVAHFQILPRAEILSLMRRFLPRRLGGS